MAFHQYAYSARAPINYIFVDKISYCTKNIRISLPCSEFRVMSIRGVLICMRNFQNAYNKRHQSDFFSFWYQMEESKVWWRSENIWWPRKWPVAAGRKYMGKIVIFHDFNPISAHFISFIQFFAFIFY